MDGTAVLHVFFGAASIQGWLLLNFRPLGAATLGVFMLLAAQFRPSVRSTCSDVASGHVINIKF